MSGRGAVNTSPALPAVPSSTRTRVARTTQVPVGFTGAQNALFQRGVPTPVHPGLPGQYATSPAPRPFYPPGRGALSSLLELSHAAILASGPSAAQGWLRELTLTEGAAGALPPGARRRVCRRTYRAGHFQRCRTSSRS